MDLLTQGVLGAAAAQSVASAEENRRAAAVGALAGLLPDADALIRSADDPLLALEVHRHFTHALVFIPVGALLAAGVAWLLLRRTLPFGRCYRYALAGISLAGVLDACTSYGTHLLWPFSSEPIAWSIVAIVDPVFTLALMVPLVIGLRGRRRTARWGLLLGVLYLGLGAGQHERAEAVAAALAADRGHQPERLLVKPTLANLVLWRSLYIADGRVYADAVRVGLAARVYPGTDATLVDPATLGPEESRLRRDAERFARFADGLLVRHPGRPLVVGDARYAMLPTGLRPLWGIVADPDAPDRPPPYVTDRTMTDAEREAFVDMLLGRQMGVRGCSRVGE